MWVHGRRDHHSERGPGRRDGSVAFLAVELANHVTHFVRRQEALVGVEELKRSRISLLGIQKRLHLQKPLFNF